MTWIPFLIVAALLIAYLMMKRSGRISTKEAADYVKKGAMIVDVRTPAEFDTGHLMQAVNMPLDRIDILLPSTVRDKDKVILLHCQSGLRSGLAKSKLAGLGYKNAYNLGSYDRATKILSGRV
jgi:phage shock protein E